MAETRNKFLVAWLTALAGLSRAACFVLVSVSVSVLVLVGGAKHLFRFEIYHSQARDAETAARLQYHEQSSWR